MDPDIDHLPAATPFAQALDPVLDDLRLAAVLMPVVEALQAAVTGPPAPPPPKPGELAWYTDNVDVRAWRYLDSEQLSVELNYTDGSRDVVLYHPDRGWRFAEGHYQHPTE
jgi:hypothetical protein